MDTYETNHMAVKHEIKSQLAKLLATEDLIVEHKQVKTASFNVHTRLLTLPMWEKASNVVYDLLVGHEVGHALFTPDEDPPADIPHQFINVTEDARIEKLMKRKYMGIGKTFFRGYSELSDQDFFDIADEDVSNMNLADRANLYFKIGNYIDISFNDEEKEIIQMIADGETFEDACAAAKVLYEYCKRPKEKVAETPPMAPQQSADGQDSEEQQDQQQTSNSSEGEGDSMGDGEDLDEVTQQIGEPEVQTADALEENIEDLVEFDGYENVYVELPKVELDAVIASNSEIHEVIDNAFRIPGNRYHVPDEKYVTFKRNAQKEVNYLVKEFECRKAADSYARATTARTGVLDCTKLHTYKYNEDLFRKVTTLADGKNHGLVFVLDWSGSMSKVMLDTMKQLYNLIWFCKKVSIPFDVYAFTNEWKHNYWDYGSDDKVIIEKPEMYEKKENLLAINDEFSMMNILTSKVNGKELEKQMRNMFRIANYFSDVYGAHYSIPQRLGLSGTPLNEALVTLHQILPKFQNENKLQKVQCIVLTDGEANQLARHEVIRRGNGFEPYIGTRRLMPESTFIRDRKIGKTYQVPYDWKGFTNIMLYNLKDKFPNTNFIGMRVLESRDANNFIKMYHSFGTNEYDRIITDWKKMRSFSIKSSGYDTYFGLSASALSNETDFEVDDGASKAKIKSAFVKSLKTKKLNKKVLGEFVELIA